ncbi:MAG: response regulator [Dongiaceae bacterium]
MAVRISIAVHLRGAGYQVLEAGNAAQAVALLGSNKVDLVFSDIRMPGEMDGFALARWDRVNHPLTLVFLTSGNVGVGERERELFAENRFFAKPYDCAEVETAMRQALATTDCSAIGR